MSDVDWDAEDFEPVTVTPPAPTDKWEGEDEEDEIKDNWDDEGEEDKDKDNSSSTVPAKNRKKNLATKIAEKEQAKRLEELEKRRKEQDEKSKAATPEEKLEEKLRIQKVQEESNFELVNDLVGEGGSTNADDENKLLDEIDLSDRDGLESFRKALVSKIRSTDRLEKRPFFVSFVEDLSRDLCQNLELEEVKRVSSVLNSLYNEKVKAGKPKNKKKSANKPKLNVAQGAIIDDIGNDFGAEYDDFM